jgi:hypothetical protein
MLCEMHTGEPYGHLTTTTGLAIKTADELARIVGEKPADVRKWLADLEKHGVFSRTAEGVIFSRKMVRDEEGRADWRDRQSWHRTKSEADESNDDVTDESRELSRGTSRESNDTKGKGNGRDTAKKPKASAFVKKGQLDTGPTFGRDLEPDVQAFLAMCTASMASGRMSAGGERSRRIEIASIVDRFGVAAARYGLREATSREANRTGYALACAKSFSTRQARDGDREELADDGAGPDSFPLLEDLIAQGVVK